MPEQLGMNYEGEELTVDEQAVMDALGRGRGNARTQAELAAATGIEARRLRQIINHLIVDHGKRIGSVATAPAGYFIIETMEELMDVCGVLRHHAMEILLRMSRLRKRTVSELLMQEILPEVGKEMNI